MLVVAVVVVVLCVRFGFGCRSSRVCNSGEKAKGDDERKIKKGERERIERREREYDGQR